MAGSATLDQTNREQLETALASVLVRPDDAAFDEARRIHNGLVDKRPALIARCRGTADVVDALALARAEGLEVSVRGGGHNVAGRAVTNGGLMIDLSQMRGIHVDPVAPTVRAQGGVTWREFNRETHLHGLATTGGAISTTGIAGLTLGGGLGWLMAKYGLAADNLVSVELVTADGRVLQPSADEHPDLFWALRGGGGNFGVATSLEYRLHPVSMVTGGLVAHPFDAARDVLEFFRDFTGSTADNDDLTVFAGLVHAPDGSGMKLAAYIVFHTGTPEQAQADLKPLLEFGSPVMTEVGPMPYPVMNTLIDEGYPKGALNYWKSRFVAALADGALEAMIEAFAECPSPMGGMVIEHFHGAVTRIGLRDTAVPHRQESYNVVIPGEWLDPADTEANVSWVRSAYAALDPYAAEGRWLNYLADDDADDAVGAAYGPNYERLREVKRQYDPENVFHLNHNIVP
jgi:FAD/FMN-containing dehydrogenase